MTLRVASLFDGVGGGILAAEAAGMDVVWRAEIDKWCNEVMAVRRPEIPNLGSVEGIDGRTAPAVDLLIGGFPCQNLSVAGNRAGLAGKQSGLWYEFERLIGELRPRWVVIENVPGLRSSNKGRDLAIILNALDERGYSASWASLDAQYRGLAQRRERVFIVGYSGADWAAPAKVLLEPEGVLGDSPPRREAGSEIAKAVGSSTGSRGSDDLDRMTFIPCYWDGGPVVFDAISVTGDIAHALRSEGGDASEDGTGRGTPIIAFSSKDDGRDATESIAPTLRSMNHDESHLDGGGQVTVALIQNATRGKGQNGLGVTDGDSPMYTLDNGSQHAVAFALFGGNSGGLMSIIEWAREHLAVRRLTPLECERLQGYPDGWTAVTMANGRPMSDSQRYRQLGNGFPVPVVTWIMKRIAAYEGGEL